jgi:hypothetical protein
VVLIRVLDYSVKHVRCRYSSSVCVPSSAADRWQALQQLRCCVQAVALQPSAAAPCMLLWEAFANGAGTLLQVLFASTFAVLHEACWCMHSALCRLC